MLLLDSALSEIQGQKMSNKIESKIMLQLCFFLFYTFKVQKVTA